MSFSGKCIRFLVVSAAVMGLASASPVFAKMGDKSVDVGVGFGTPPESGWGTGLGFSIGGGYEIQDDLQIRGDISYNKWSLSQYGWTLSWTRMPIAVSGRQYIPLQPNLKAYGQAGLELSFDSFESAWSWGATTYKGTASETNIGLPLGGGVEYAISPQFSVGADVKWHLINHSYFTLGVNAGYHF